MGLRENGRAIKGAEQTNPNCWEKPQRAQKGPEQREKRRGPKRCTQGEGAALKHGGGENYPLRTQKEIYPPPRRERGAPHQRAREQNPPG